MFLDETWAKTNMARPYGRCRRGERLRVSVPHGHWKTTTFVGALTLRGFIAPFVIDGPINREAFETYVARVLVPELRGGDIVVMDNLSGHTGPKVRAMIEAAGASLRYLPPYTLRLQLHTAALCGASCRLRPDFNPIENAFANSPPASPTGFACRSLKPAPLKALLRKAAERTVDGLWTAIGRLIDLFPPSECANYFAAAGYDAD